MRFLLILFTIINFSFSGALYFGLDFHGTGQYGNNEFQGSESKSNAITIGYNHGMKQWDRVSVAIGGSYTLTPIKLTVNNSKVDASFLTFNTSAWYNFSNKISGWASLGLNKPLGDLDGGNLGLTSGNGLYYTINDKVGIGLGTVKNNTKNAISGANGDYLFNRTIIYVGYRLN